jgi:hypothetical protein
LKRNTAIAVKKIEWKYPMKKINNRNNDVARGTEEKVYSAVVSSNNECCLMMAHMWLKHVAARAKNIRGTVINFVDCGFIASYYKVFTYTYTDLHRPSK